MTNLDRLKGTDLLIDGFDQFLKLWLGVAPREEPLPWSGEEKELFDSLPWQVRRFYEVVHRWPTSKIVEKNNQDALMFPPGYQMNWNPDTRAYDVPDPKRIELVSENQGNWVVWLSRESKTEGRLCTDFDRNFEEGVFPMEVPIDEFLVTFGFHELVINGGFYEEYDPELYSESQTIFSGCYHADVPIRVLYHPSRLVWLVYGEDEAPFWCARQGGEGVGDQA